MIKSSYESEGVQGEDVKEPAEGQEK